MSSRPWKIVALVAVAGVFIASWVHPPWPREQALQSTLTVAGVLWLVWHARRWPMRDRDFIAVCGFLCAHSVAARWLYSYVPYDTWLQAATHWSPQQAFGWQRNHTDRLIHLLRRFASRGAVGQRLGF